MAKKTCFGFCLAKVRCEEGPETLTVQATSQMGYRLPEAAAEHIISLKFFPEGVCEEERVSEPLGYGKAAEPLWENGLGIVVRMRCDEESLPRMFWPSEGPGNLAKHMWQDYLFVYFVDLDLEKGT